MQLVGFFLCMGSAMFNLNDFVPIADYVVVPHHVEIIQAYQVSVKLIHSDCSSPRKLYFQQVILQ